MEEHSDAQNTSSQELKPSRDESNEGDHHQDHVVNNASSSLLEELRAELKAFDESKESVKGLVDSGVTKVPRIFLALAHAHAAAAAAANVDPTNTDTNTAVVSSGSHSHNQLHAGITFYVPQFLRHSKIPIIDLHNLHYPVLHADVVSRIRKACMEWGFFLVVNHGIPHLVLDEMLRGIRRFHELDDETKKTFYTRDKDKKVRYSFSGNLGALDYDHPADWRDTIGFDVCPNPPELDEIPEACRYIVIEYTNQVRQLGFTIFEILSEALRLPRFYLEELGCADALTLMGHYFPACPEPELTMGATKHTNSDFINILLQDQLGGLQVLHRHQWVNVPPLYGALVVSIGDILQQMSGGRFVSAKYRVISQYIGPRISVSSLFTCSSNTAEEDASKVKCPTEELVPEETQSSIPRDNNIEDSHDRESPE